MPPTKTATQASPRRNTNNNNNDDDKNNNTRMTSSNRNNGEEESAHPRSRYVGLPGEEALVEQIYATVVHLGDGGGSGGNQRTASTSFDDVAGAPDAKQVLQEAVQLPLALPELFSG
jgi:hypothetical protein